MYLILFLLCAVFLITVFYILYLMIAGGEILKLLPPLVIMNIIGVLIQILFLVYYT